MCGRLNGVISVNLYSVDASSLAAIIVLQTAQCAISNCSVNSDNVHRRRVVVVVEARLDKTPRTTAFTWLQIWQNVISIQNGWSNVTWY